MSKLESRPENQEKKAIREKLRTGKNETTNSQRTKGPMVSRTLDKIDTVVFPLDHNTPGGGGTDLERGYGDVPRS